jgi:hypothetical protein
MVAAAWSALLRPFRNVTGGSACSLPMLEEDVIESGTVGADSVPLVAPPVGLVRRPGVVTGSPFPSVLSVVQPNATSVNERESATSARVALRWDKLLFFKALFM